MEEQGFIKEKVASVLVEIAKREWQLTWKSLAEDLQTVASLGLKQAELVLIIYRTLSQEIFTFAEDLPSSRIKLLRNCMKDLSKNLLSYLYQVGTNTYTNRRRLIYRLVHLSKDLGLCLRLTFEFSSPLNALLVCVCVIISASFVDSQSQVFQIGNELIQVSITVSPNSTHISSLQYSLILAGKTDGWTPNLLAISSNPETQSSTAMEIANASRLVLPFGGTGISNKTTAIISDVKLGEIATENWTISVDGNSLIWSVNRTFTASGQALSDSFPRIWLQTTIVPYKNLRESNKKNRNAVMPSDWENQVQIPSFVNIDSDLLDPNLGYGYQIQNGNFVMTLSNFSEYVRLIMSPSGVAVHLSFNKTYSEKTNKNFCRFGMTRQHSAFVQQLGLSSECAVGSQNQYNFFSGQKSSGRMQLDFLSTTQGHGFFDLELPPNASNDTKMVMEQMSIFAKIYSMPLGWIFGNSPACETCLHELSVFPQLQGLFRLEPVTGQFDKNPLSFSVPEATKATNMHTAFSKHMEFVLQQSIDKNGEVAPRWSIADGNDWSFNGIIDQMPHVVLATYYHAINTGNKSLILSYMPKMRLIMNYMLTAMQINTTFLLTNSFCNGVANVSCADNWLDDVRFGWHDAIVGAYAVEAFRAMSEVELWLGNVPESRILSQIYEKMVVAYNNLYWDENNQAYTDWVDKNGNKRHYFYVWQNYVTIIFNIANRTRAQAILNTAANLYKSIALQFNKTNGIWCAPTNLIPLKPEDLTVNFDDEYVYPHYENGDCFHWHLGLEILAQSRVNGPNAAFERLSKAMEVFKVNRLWGQRYSWTSEIPMGSDVITDGFWLAYGGIMGSLNIQVTLGGVKVLGPAAPQLEGTKFTFGFLGNDITVVVKGGVARVISI